MDQNKLILVEQHFRPNDDDINKDTKFTITERIETYRKIFKKSMNEKKRQMDKKSENICVIWIWYEI